VICPNDNNAEYLSVKKPKLGHMIDEDNSNSRNIDPFISIFLDGEYKSIDLVPIKNPKGGANCAIFLNSGLIKGIFGNVV